MAQAARSTGAFFYYAVTPRGGRRFGVRPARSERALAERLRRERLTLLRAWKAPAALTPDRRLKLKDHAILNEQLAQLLTRGVPLVEALEVTGETVAPAARPIVQQMQQEVSGGAAFAAACERTGRFDRVTVAVYAAAERTGDLGGAAQQLARTAKRQMAVAGKAATLMLYPVIVLVISILVAAGLLMLVVPRIGESLMDLNPDKPLPALTRLSVGAGTFLRDHAVWVGVAVMALIVALVIGRGVVAALAARMARTLPVIKDVVLAQESARFFAVMAAMTRAGVPLSDALSIANLAVSLPTLRRQLDSLRQKLVEGGMLRLLIDRVEALPLATRRLLIAAERSGDLESAFDTLAEDMAHEVDVRSQRLLAVLEPLLIVFIFAVIGTLMLSIMLPLMSAANQSV